MQRRRDESHWTRRSPPSLSACLHSPSLQLPNPTLFLVQGRRSRGPCKPQSSSSMAGVQICILAPSSSMLTIPGVVVERRAAPSRPCRRGMPLGEQPRLPDPPRVSVWPGPIAQRWWTWFVDSDLIRRTASLRNGSVAPAADRRAPFVRWFEPPAPARVLASWAGPALACVGRADLARFDFF
jgi:hypothetical protein